MPLPRTELAPLDAAAGLAGNEPGGAPQQQTPRYGSLPWPLERPRENSLMTAIKAVLKGATGIAVLVAIFELLRTSGVLPAGAVPGSFDIAKAIIEGTRSGSLSNALADTVLAVVLGLAAGAALGVPLGLASGASTWFDATTERAVEFLRPIPAVALVPIAIILFGIDRNMQVFLIAVACLWPILIGTRAGVRAVDPLHVAAARTLGLGNLRIAARVVLPSSVPAIATSVRVAASLAVVVAIAAELISGSPGLGALLIEEMRSGNDDLAWACLVVAGILGVVTNVALVAIERRLAGWQEESTEGRR